MVYGITKLGGIRDITYDKKERHWKMFYTNTYKLSTNEQILQTENEIFLICISE